MKLKKGDKIQVIAGKDKGREGVIERVYEKRNMIAIPAINIYRRHIKKSEQVPEGGVVEVPRPLAVSKVMLICSKCGKLTRVGYQTKNNQKIRICKLCKSKI